MACLSKQFVFSFNRADVGPTTPSLSKQTWFGLFRFSLATTDEITIVFSFSGY
eukprot:TRINITY_DN53_c0_g1_i15.p3 TRINITY_DN53_c0_g1~~TRINITY_DN53_c0_g1_i15.p3  ORF type:complete len:53 (+),score=1.70 TRINITY_DN53_c0_g1_i15:562-720(+)